MEGLVSHVLNARSDTRRPVRCGCRYESLDDWSTVLIRELECASVHNKLEIGCSPVIVTSRTGSPTVRAWLASGRNPYNIDSSGIRGPFEHTMELCANWLIAYLASKA